MWLLDKLLRRLVREGRLRVTDHDGKTYDYGPEGGQVLAIRLTDAKVARDIATNPRMAAGEAYMDGRLVVEPPHDIRDFVLFVMGQANRHGGLDKPKGKLRRAADRLAYRLDRLNTRRRASDNVVHHYGLTRQFYELFLDEDRQYSMAYFRGPADSLERAQLDKKALIAAKLRLGPDMRLLDIGCGWGGLGLYYHRHFGCEVLGVSLAPDQVKFANERAEAAGVADKVRFELIDYRDVEGPFDRISSVGMFEHVGARHYDEYFAKTWDLLADEGIMLTHTIGRQGPPSSDDAWSRKYIFPGHHLPAISEMTAAMERTGWEIADIEFLRYHYAHTLAEWYRRAKQHEREIGALYDERFFRMWQFYLAGAEQGFRGAGMVNFQVQSAKRRDALPMTRDYIVHEAARLSALDDAPPWHLAQSAGQRSSRCGRGPGLLAAPAQFTEPLRMSEIRRVVLAYSGGLDTSVILKWLQVTYGCEVVTFTADLGQEGEIEPARDKARLLGIPEEHIFIDDLKEEFVRDFVFPMMRANARYEGDYLLGTSIARPLIAKRLVEIARATGADAVAHGATGKGNDQVRFELGVAGLAPDIKVIAPWREWDLTSRTALIEWAESHQIPVPKDKRNEAPFSTDANLLHTSSEGKVLEDVWEEVPDYVYSRTINPEDAPDQPEYITIDFERGDGTGLNGQAMSPATLLSELNELGRKHGIGRLDLVENRFVGMKSRGMYETPGGEIYARAHRGIEQITLDRGAAHLKDELMPRYAELIYNGFWFAPEREMLQAAIDHSQAKVSGTVRLKLYKGMAQVVGRKSPNSLYSERHVTFEDDAGAYDQKDAAGFIRLNALRLRLLAHRDAAPI